MSGAGWTYDTDECAVLNEDGYEILRPLLFPGGTEEQIEAHGVLAAAAPAMARALEADAEYEEHAEPEGLTDDELIAWVKEDERLYQRAQRLKRDALRSARGGGGGE